MVNYLANYKKDSLSWDNYIDLRYGFLKEDGNELTKSSDRIEFNSKVGYNTGGRWNYAGLVNFKSQFAPGYNGSHDKVVGNDIKMNLCNKSKDKYVNSARSLQGAG